MPRPRPAARWRSPAQHHRVYQHGTDTDKIRYLGALRLDPVGEVGRIGAQVLQQYIEPADAGRPSLGPLALAMLNVWADVDTGNRTSSRHYDAPSAREHRVLVTSAAPGPAAPGIGTDSGRMIRRAIAVLAEPNPHNWRRFVEGLGEVEPFLGTQTVGALLTNLDDPGVVRHKGEFTGDRRPAFELACHMAVPADRCWSRPRRVDPKVAGKAMFFSTWLADALVDRVGLTGAEVTRTDD